MASRGWPDGPHPLGSATLRRLQGAPVNDIDIKKLEAHLKRTFGNPQDRKSVV